MSRHIPRSYSTVLALLAAASGAAGAQQKVPVRNLSAASAKTAEPLGAVFGVRQLPGGKLLVNDATRHRVLLFDSTLTKYKVVIDSAPGAVNSYGSRSTPIIPYVGDSTLFVDAASQSMLVIDPTGKIARTMAAPHPEQLPYLAQSGSGVDNKGRLIYRGVALPVPKPRGPDGKFTMSAFPDSTPVIRADFEARTIDTIGRVKTLADQRTVILPVDGKQVVKTTINPLTSLDEWAVLSDGSVAFVRGADYHIDWLHPDESRTSSAKLPFDWKRLTDEDKQRLIDSARTAQAKPADAAKAGGADGPTVMTSMGGGGGGGGVVSVGGAGGGAMTMSLPSNGNMPKPQIEFVPLSEMADYYPPIRQGAAMPDLDGKLWILPTTSAQSIAGELVYDVVNHKGELTERVRMPAGRSVAGFGRGGIVYLMWKDRDKGWYLERTRLLEAGKASQ
jgi:hypothetical protein